MTEEALINLRTKATQKVEKFFRKTKKRNEGFPVKIAKASLLKAAVPGIEITDVEFPIRIANDILQEFSKKVTHAKKKELETWIESREIFGFNPTTIDTNITEDDAHYQGQLSSQLIAMYNNPDTVARNLVLLEMVIPDTSECFISPKNLHQGLLFTTKTKNVFLGIARQEQFLPSGFKQNPDLPKLPPILTERLYFIPDGVNDKSLKGISSPYDPFKYPFDLH